VAALQDAVVIITGAIADVLLVVATTIIEAIADAPLVVEITIVKVELWVLRLLKNHIWRRYR
jgi:hypothetical protein